MIKRMNLLPVLLLQKKKEGGSRASGARSAQKETQGEAGLDEV